MCTSCQHFTVKSKIAIFNIVPFPSLNFTQHCDYDLILHHRGQKFCKEFDLITITIKLVCCHEGFIKLNLNTNDQTRKSVN